MLKVWRLSMNDFEKFKNFTNHVPFDAESIWFGATLHDLPCGVLLTSRNKKNPDVCQIDQFFVHPSVRRMGIATQLFNKLLKEIKKLGYKELCFDASTTKEQIDELYLFLKNYGFDQAEIPANIYSIDYDALASSGKINRFANSKVITPSNIEILPLDKVDKKLIHDLKEKVDIDYAEIYDPFPADDRFKLKHINTFVAVANSNEIVAWMVGLDGFEDFIFYKTLFVKKEYRHLALGLLLMKSCIKTHIKKYPNRYALLGVSLKNDRALKFVSTYFKGVNMKLSHEFIFKKII